jgi:glycosyltransferase involved in cell wall biosynthesis
MTVANPTPPRVTAIIIVLNGERFIGEAIASVVAQSYADWELLVVDDGSSDGTIPIVEDVARSDPRIRLLHHPDRGNHGMSATRNVGIAAAQGEFIGFLDADDVWLAEKLEQQVAILDAEPETAMVYGRTLIWHQWEHGAARQDYFYGLGVAPDRCYAPPLLFHQLLLNHYQSPTTCNALMRRSAVLAVGGFDPSFRTMFEDQLFFAKMMLDYWVHVSAHCWARYRQHGAAISAREAGTVDLAAAHRRYLVSLRVHLKIRRRAYNRERLAIERQLLGLRLRGAERMLRSRVRLRTLR